MPLEFNISEKQATVQRVELSGRLDTLTAPQLDRALDDVPPDTRMLIFDMTALDYISSAGIRSIFKATKSVQRNGGRAGVLNMQPQIRKVFDIVKAMPDVPIFRNDEEMDEYLDAMQKKIIDGGDLS